VERVGQSNPKQQQQQQQQQQNTTTTITATMSAAPPTTDPADEAGGEVFYSSDGLSPVPLTKAPPVASAATATASTADGDQDEAILDSDDISPQQAFEVFKGKVYSVQAMKTTTIAKSGESPMERLARLQSEVSDLEAQFRSAASTGGRDFDEQLVELATDLRGRLMAASTIRLMEQEDLTRMIQGQVQALDKQPDKSSGGGGSGSGSGGTTTGVVYELYGTKSNSTTSSTRQPPTSALEQRILKLETALGSGSGAPKAASSGTTFASRLDELETLMATVDPIKLEQASTKAKVIRADLEAASKARNKLTATYKKEDSKMIQELHQQMVDLEGLSGHLPTLVQRLQQLSGLHVTASTFGTRLEELERSATNVEGTVSHLEQTMGELKVSMKHNLLAMQQNLANLDDRLKKL
jgi:hypothetical protein